MTLAKAIVVEDIQKRLGITKNESADLIETVLEIMKRTLESGEDVLISGFGRFFVQNKKSRRGRNPSTGNDLQLPARRVVSFKCSRVLREKINRNAET